MKPSYGIVAFDSAEIISMEAVFPEMTFFVGFSQGAVRKQERTLNSSAFEFQL